MRCGCPKPLHAMNNWTCEVTVEDRTDVHQVEDESNQQEFRNWESAIHLLPRLYPDDVSKSLEPTQNRETAVSGQVTVQDELRVPAKVERPFDPPVALRFGRSAVQLGTLTSAAYAAL